MASSGQKKSEGFLGRVLDPISVEEFASDYFGRRPLLVRGARDKFDFIMKPNAFIHGLDRVREIRCVFDELRQASIGPADVKEMFDAGATICVTGLEAAHKRLEVAARRARRELGFLGRVDFRAYLSPPGKGFAFHYDARVATVLQLDGTKTWWYSREPECEYPTANSSRGDMGAVRQRVSKHKLRKTVLKPGDLLCLPPGVWHKAESGAGGSLALNLAFNHIGATLLDLALNELREILHRSRDCRQPFVMGPQNGLLGLDEQWLNCIRAIESQVVAMRSNASAVKVGRRAMKNKSV